MMVREAEAEAEAEALVECEKEGEVEGRGLAVVIAGRRAMAKRVQVSILKKSADMSCLVVRR